MLKKLAIAAIAASTLAIAMPAISSNANAYIVIRGPHWHHWHYWPHCRLVKVWRHHHWVVRNVCRAW